MILSSRGDHARYISLTWTRDETSDLVNLFQQKLTEHQSYSREHFVDLPEIINWCWSSDGSTFDAPTP